MKIEPAQRAAYIREKLTAALAPIHMEILDESAAHAGHNAAAKKGGTHFRIKITSDAFTGRSRMERHRMIYVALAEAMKKGLHALTIEAHAPGDLQL